MTGRKGIDKKRRDVFSDYSASGESSSESSPLPNASGSQEIENEAVQQLYPSQLRPDPFQPRPSPLPGQIRSLYTSGQIDAYGAARMWLEYAENDPDGYGERVKQYLNLGRSLEEDGQVNPITVVWNSDLDVFLIETGEQRFWSAVLQCVAAGQMDEPVLRAIIKDQLSVERQVVENLLKFEPSAVTHAREVARLILKQLGRSPEEGQYQDAYDYFRQVAHINRLPNGIWNQVLPKVPIGRRRVAQLIQILKLPSELLDLADLYNLSDTTLRDIISAPEVEWERLVIAAVQEKQASRQAEDEPAARSAVEPDPVIAEKRSSTPSTRVPQKMLATRWVRRFHKLVSRLSARDPYVVEFIADEIIADGNSADVVQTLEKFTQAIRVRMEGKAPHR